MLTLYGKNYTRDEYGNLLRVLLLAKKEMACDNYCDMCGFRASCADIMRLTKYVEQKFHNEEVEPL